MKKTIIFLIGIAILLGGLSVFVVKTGIGIETGGHRAAWQVLDGAYVTHDNRSIVHYSHARDLIVKYYAEALLNLSDHHFTALLYDGKRCYDAVPETASDAATLFQCLFAVTGGLNIANKPKESYIWESKAKKFYKRYSKLIDKGMASSNPHGIKDLQMPPLHVIEKWPKQSAIIANNWSAITLDNGVAQAKVGDMQINMRIDTGSTGIFLSDDVIEKLKHKNEIVSLNAVGNSLGNAGGKKNREYYVPRLQLGPITIFNAYVHSSGRSYSLFGLTYLSLLKKFTFSGGAIVRLRKSPSALCSTMRFSHLPVAYAASFAYLDLPTSLGRLGFILDSGLTGRGAFSQTTVMLKRKFGVKVVKAGKVEGVSSVIGTFAGSSRRVRFQTAVFRLNVGGVPTKGYIGLSSGVGQRVAGSMTRNFLRLFEVSYDFPDRIMCIARKKSNS